MLLFYSFSYHVKIGDNQSQESAAGSVNSATVTSIGENNTPSFHNETFFRFHQEQQRMRNEMKCKERQSSETVIRPENIRYE